MKTTNVLILLGAMISVSLAHGETAPRQFLVKLASGHKAFDALGRTRKMGALRKLPESNIYVVDLNQGSTQEQLRAIPGVLVVEPNITVHIDRTPNDPLFDGLWGMRNTGQMDAGGQVGTAGIDLGLEKAWDLPTTPSKVTVAIIDTGIDLQHPDLKENLWTNPVEAAGEAGKDDDGNGYVDDLNGYDFVGKKPDPKDDNRHGTHVSGTIGARGNNGIGVAGVSWNAGLMGLKAFDSRGKATMDALLEAVHYAVKMDAKIINASWGGTETSELLKEAIAQAGARGILFVAAAGNDGDDNDRGGHYPANYPLPNIVSVAGIDNKGELSEFSSYGKKTVHLAAPGTSILSTIPGGYGRLSGTSMAAPHVSGVAALMLAQDPQLSAVEMKERLFRSSALLPALKERIASRGAVNAYYAVLNQAAPLPPSEPETWDKTIPLNISTPHPYQKDQNFSWEVRIPGAKKIALYFENFETEDPYDRVTLETESGGRITDFAGKDGKGWTIAIRGSFVRVRFHSDARNHFYGFDLTKAAYQ